MKTKLCSFLPLLFMLVFSTVKAQLATFDTNLQSYNITMTSATISNIITSNTSVTVYYQLATGNAGNVALAPTAGGGSNTSGTWVTVRNLNSLTPNTTYYFRFRADNASGTSYSGTGSFTTLSGAPTISITSTPTTSNSATINYSLNAWGNATTSLVRYGLTSGNLSSQVVGNSASGTTDTPSTVNIPSLLPNTTYYYQVEATNSVGTTMSTIGNFTTASLPNSLIADYRFDFGYSDINNNNPFTANSGTSFTTDRNGNVNSALSINNTGITAVIPGLPYGNSPRTISFWAKTTSMWPSYNMTFSYGQSSGSSACGGSFNGSIVEFLGYGNNFSANSANTNNTWYYFTYTYDGTTAKIYKNGTLLTSTPKTWNTLNNNNIFKLGVGVGGELSFIGAIDDLKIHNYVISDAQITQLYLGSAVPEISNISVNPSSNGARINYTVNAKNAATTTVIKYGLSSGALVNQATGFSASGNTNTPGYLDLTGLSNYTTYYFEIEATNSIGITTSTIGTFSTGLTSAIADYRFDNSYNNINGTNPFSSNGGTSFTTDRYGVPNSALNIVNTGSNATINNLPYSNSARTISFWAKLNVLQAPYNMTFSYGQSNTSNACGGSFNNTAVEFFGFGNNLSGNSSNAVSTWYFFTYTYDGTNAKIYKNGILLSSVPKTWNTLNNSNIFKLGTGVGGELTFNGAIDDLKIFNYVLSDSQITELYTTNTLSASSFNQNNLEAGLYPNPVQDVLNISIENQIAKVEVYTIQGQKIMESNSNEINMSALTSGIYLVKIIDENNAIATKKVVKK